MAWNEAKAYVTATGAAVRVGVQQIGKGNARLMVSIGAQLFKELGEPENVNVFVGDGAVPFRVAQKGGASIKLNPVPGMPAKKMKPAGVKYEELEAVDTGNKQLSITLPW